MNLNMSIKIISLGYLIDTENNETIYITPKTELNGLQADKIISDFFNNFKIQSVFVNKSPDEIKDLNKIFLNTKYGKSLNEPEPEPEPEQEKPLPDIKPKIKTHTIINIWEKVKNKLDDEFTTLEYIDSLKKSKFVYTSASWNVVPLHQLKRLCINGRIKLISKDKERPNRYKKVKIPTSELNKKDLKSLRDGEKVILDTFLR